MDQQETWVESGKQIGKSDYCDRDGQRFWQSVAIQKYQMVYYAYFFEVPEAKMMLDTEDEKELLREFSNVSDAIDFLNEISPIPFADFAPFKGQKAFQL